MKEVVKNWIEQSKRDLDTAKYNFEGGKYEFAVFLCQQSIEKALKALSIKKTGKFRKIHDIVLLGKELNLPENLINYCKEVAPAYTYTRYPDVTHVTNLKDISKKFIKYAEENLKWVEKQL